MAGSWTVKLNAEDRFCYDILLPDVCPKRNEVGGFSEYPHGYY